MKRPVSQMAKTITFAALVAVALAAAFPVCAQYAPGSPEEALFESVIANDMAGVQASLDAGADVMAQDLYGNTPADVAVDRGYFDIAHYLLGVANRERELKHQQSETPPPSETAVIAEPDPAAQPVPAPTPTFMPEPVAEPEPVTPPPAPPARVSGPSPFDVDVPPQRPATPVRNAPAPQAVANPAPLSEPVDMPEADLQADTLPAAPVSPPPAVEVVREDPAFTPAPEPVAVPAPRQPAPAAVVRDPAPAVSREAKPEPEPEPTPEPERAAAGTSFMAEFLSFILPGDDSTGGEAKGDGGNSGPTAADLTPAQTETQTETQTAALPAVPVRPARPMPVRSDRTIGAVLGVALGASRDDAHFHKTRTCTQKSQARAACIESVAWPDGVLAHADDIDSGIYRRNVGNRGMRSVVGYENGVATFVHTIFAAADFDAAVRHFTAVFGAPDVREERIAAPLGAPRVPNRVLKWYGADGGNGRQMVVEVMNYDDTRDIFPNMEEGAVVVKYDDAVSAFSFVTPIELIGLF